METTQKVMESKLMEVRDKLEAVAEELDAVYIIIQAEEVRESIKGIDECLLELQNEGV